MPTFKHPCPHCGKYIARDVAACPFCASPDPFAPARCPNCRTIIEDRSWTACPKCGQVLVAAQPAPGAAAPAPSTGAAAPTSGATQPQGRKCTGCGAPLAEGARFCTVCGTLAA